LTPQHRRAIVPAMLTLLLVEYNATPIALTDISDKPGLVHAVLRGLTPGPVLELPLPRSHALPGHDPLYELWSIHHWNPLVNGYSGYYPASYFEMLASVSDFPDDRSIAYLQALAVRYVIVHRHFYEYEDYRSLVAAIVARPEVVPRGEYNDTLNNA